MIIILAFFILSVPAHAFAACTGEAHLVTISGHSLMPLLADGAQVPMMPAACAGPIHTGDLVIFRTGAHAQAVIKIVKAVPGQSFSVKGNGLWVDGQMVTNSQGHTYEFSAAKAAMLQSYVRDYDGIIPPHTYLVLGDHISGGLDSSRIGLIHRQDIVMAGRR